MSSPLSFGLIGAGWIGSFHAQTLASRLPNTRLAAVADPIPAASERFPDQRYYRNPLELIADPDVDAVAICSPAASHADLVVAAAQAGKHVFCEKPMALTLDDADRAVDAARAAGVALQVGFNRRFAVDFAAMRAAVDAGAVGTPQLLRSLTRDPGISAEVAARVKPWTIFNETLIHDFDTLAWLNPGARVTEVYAQADALVHPQFAEQGFLDTSVVQLRFDNGAFAVAEASFQAVYGYDIRGEVFGSGGVLQAGLAPEHAGRVNTELFADAYTAQFGHFADSVLAGTEPSVTGADARIALEIALAARRSVETKAPVGLIPVASNPVPA
jgi:myo-inositol 2-dehydrogenase/D-chiro-inositol 1-dehydrogenase